MAESYQNRYKTLWEKEKLLVTSNFSFSHSVFKRLVSQGHKKVSLCGNMLPFPKRQILDSSKPKVFADNDFKFDKRLRKVLEKGRKHCGEKEKLLVTSNFSFSHSVFKRIVQQTRKNQGLFGKGLIMTDKYLDSSKLNAYSDENFT